jgi:hypothetical protein
MFLKYVDCNYSLRVKYCYLLPNTDTGYFDTLLKFLTMFNQLFTTKIYYLLINQVYFINPKYLIRLTEKLIKRNFCDKKFQLKY